MRRQLYRLKARDGSDRAKTLWFVTRASWELAWDFYFVGGESIKPNRIKFRCEECGKEVEQKKSVYLKSKHHFCSTECKAKWQEKKILCTCEVCGKKVFQKQTDYNRHIHHYCSQECSAKGTHILNSEFRKCEYCNALFNVRKSSPKRFCSTLCQHKWQETLVGKLAVAYKRTPVFCEQCGREYDVEQSRLNSGMHHFCSVKCRQEWFANTWSQKEEWKNTSRERALGMLTSGKMSHTDTKPQIAVNRMLDTLEIPFVNEQRFGKYSIDNYLPKYNLCIEVMGDYWHCSPVKYSSPINAVQETIIRKDGIKRQYIEGAGSHVLYLWEKDILSRGEVCKKLIIAYVNRNGSLTNYNSFNYSLDKSGELVLARNILAFQENSKVA